MFSKHEVLSHVTLDRETEFISKFFRSLAQALEMGLYFSTGYHLEMDGQTECTNQTLEQYLQIYCNYQQSDWFRLLLLVEFTYNNMSLSTIGLFLFFANKDYYPSLQVWTAHELSSQSAKKFVVDLEIMHMKLKWAIAKV